jgi:hypothetical protein
MTTRTLVRAATAVVAPLVVAGILALPSPAQAVTKLTDPEYHEHYYGAFVRDPDGNNVEAVCHTATAG